MLRRFSERLADFVTTHNRIVILVVLVLTAGIVAGVGQDTGGADEAGLDDDEIGDTEVYQAYEYIQDRYGDGENANAQETLQVYVRDEDGSVLTREGLLTALDYQIEASSQDAVADALVAG
ncbi:RND transporter, partial [Halobacteriales archaeon QH_6_66_25]